MPKPSSAGIEDRLSSLEKKFSGIEKVLVKIRPIDIQKYSSLVKGLNRLDDEFDYLQKEIKAINIEHIKKEVDELLRKLHLTIRETLEKNSVMIKTSEEEINILKNQLEEIRQLNIKKLLREIEILKIKTQWLEKHADEMDINPIIEMIQELENKINILSLAQPLIIE